MQVNNGLIIDTETTGFHPNKGAQCIEVGALLYNFYHRKVIQTCSFFLPCVTNQAQHVNHIEPEWTRCANAKGGIEFIKAMAADADVYVAHNASFDILFMRTIIDPLDVFWAKRWVCTKNNFNWPVKLVGKKLMDVCNAMGVPYVDAHRALTDCQFIADCFSKVPNLQQEINRLVTG